MAKAMRWRHLVTCGVLALLVACAGAGPATPGQQRSNQVRQELDALGQGLRAGSWSRVERFFSPANPQGYGELRDRMEQQFRQQRVIDLQFIVGRVLESDGLVNAQVRWNKSWVDKVGKPGRSSGTSEFVLQPHGAGYRILRITGDRLF